jgi:hypothetical protein
MRIFSPSRFGRSTQRMSGSIGIETLRHGLIVSEKHTISFFLRLEVWLQEATLTRFWTKHPEFRKIIVAMQSAGARRVLIIVALQSSGCSRVWLCRPYYQAHTKLSLPHADLLSFSVDEFAPARPSWNRWPDRGSCLTFRWSRSTSCHQETSDGWLGPRL